jgi:cellulose synthase/poly-beta-1,6-N-acetylglucosamine synthase-like glycosyltransferase
MNLPKPPCGDEINLYERTDKPRLYAWALFSFGTLLCGMLLFAHAHRYFWLYALIGCLAISYLFMSYLVGLLGDSNVPHAFKPLTRRPKVDVFYTICGEPLEVCENALGYIMAMQRAYGDEATVYVLDDSPEAMGAGLVEKFSGAGRIAHLRRPDPGKDKKAGNLRYAFAHTDGEFIAIFDADFCPVEGYLERLLPFLLEDERLAIVQSPQFFTVEDHVSWVGRGSANIQELFYRMIQVSRNTFNAAICVGTCAVYRRKALEPFGGTALVHYSEDMRTGFNCIRLGWRIRYVPYNLAKGLCPDDLNGFINQQYRWSLGSMSLCFNREFWSTPLSFMQRFCYLSGMFYYIITGAGLFLTFLPISLILIFAPDLAHWYNVFFTVPSLIYITLVYSRWTKSSWGLHTPRSMQVAFYCHVLALFDYLRGTLVPWEATGAVKNRRLYARYLTLVRFRTAVYALGLTGLMYYRLPEVGWVNLLPTSFLLVTEVALNQSVQ